MRKWFWPDVGVAEEAAGAKDRGTMAAGLLCFMAVAQCLMGPHRIVAGLLIFAWFELAYLICKNYFAASIVSIVLLVGIRVPLFVNGDRNGALGFVGGILFLAVLFLHSARAAYRLRQAARPSISAADGPPQTSM